MKNIVKTLFILCIIALTLVASTTDSQAKSRKKKKIIAKPRVVRHYDPQKTRQTAISTIRTSSQQISELAGVGGEVATESEDVEATPLAINRINPQDAVKYQRDRTNAVDEEGEDLDELEAEDDVIVDMDAFRSLWLSFLGEEDGGDAYILCGIAKQDIMNTVMGWLGTPYLFGGTSRQAIDCSAFVRSIYAQTGNIMLPRTAAEQSTIGNRVSRKNLQFGDLIFFNTRREVYVSHVGIYLGDNLFVHASSRYGVTVSSLESAYYDKRFIGAKRLTQRDIVKLTTNSNGKFDN